MPLDKDDRCRLVIGWRPAGSRGAHRKSLCEATGTHDPDDALAKLQSVIRRAMRRVQLVSQWSNCTTHPDNAQVDAWLDDLNTAVAEAHTILGLGNGGDGIRLS